MSHHRVPADVDNALELISAAARSPIALPDDAVDIAEGVVRREITWLQGRLEESEALVASERIVVRDRDDAAGRRSRPWWRSRWLP